MRDGDGGRPKFPLRMTAAGLNLETLAKAAVHASGEQRSDDGPKSLALAHLIGWHARSEHHRRESLKGDKIPKDLEPLDIGPALTWDSATLADALEMSDQLARSPTQLAESEYFGLLHTGLVYVVAGRLRGDC